MTLEKIRMNVTEVEIKMETKAILRMFQARILTDFQNTHMTTKLYLISPLNQSSHLSTHYCGLAKTKVRSAFGQRVALYLAKQGKKLTFEYQPN